MSGYPVVLNVYDMVSEGTLLSEGQPVNSSKNPWVKNKKEWESLNGPHYDLDY